MKKATIAWIILGFFVFLTAAIMLVAPFAIRHFGEQWLTDEGVVDGSIGPISINPFTATASVEQVEFGGPDLNGHLGVLSAEWDWGALWQKRILLHNIHIDQTDLGVQQHSDGTLQLGGLKFPAAEEPAQPEPAEPEPIEFGLSDAKVTSLTVRYVDEQLDQSIDIDTLTVDDLATWKSGDLSNIAAQLQHGSSQIDANIAVNPLSEKQHVDLDLKLSHMDLAEYVSLAQPFLEPQLQTMEITGQADVVVNATIDLADGLFATSASTQVKVEPLALKFEAQELRHEDLTLDTQVDIEIDDNREIPLEFQVEAKLHSGPAQGSLEVPEWSIISEFAAFDIESISVTRDALKISTIKADALNSQITHKQVPVSSEEVEVEAEEAESEQSDPTPEQPLFRVSIGEASMTTPGTVHWIDQTTEPEVISDLTLTTVSVKDFDMGGSDPMLIDIAATQGDSGNLAANGSLHLFDKPMNADMLVTLEHIDLPQVSPYIPGYDLEQGRANATTTVQITAGELDVNNDLVIEKVKIVGQSTETPDWLEGGDGMPLDVLLGLLKDRDGTIRLEVPVTGSIDDPNFGVGNIVRFAIGKAMQKAAIAYAATALQPLGAIMFVTKVAGEAARPSFEPVPFEPMSAQLTSEGTQYIDKVAEMLDKRPGLSITFCGIATATDQPAPNPALDQSAAPEPGQVADVNTQEGTAPGVQAAEATPAPPIDETALLELAKERRTVVFDYFIKTYAIDEERLYACQPTIDSEPEAKPRVRMFL